MIIIWSINAKYKEIRLYHKYGAPKEKCFSKQLGFNMILLIKHNTGNKGDTKGKGKSTSASVHSSVVLPMATSDPQQPPPALQVSLS